MIHIDRKPRILTMAAVMCGVLAIISGLIFVVANNPVAYAAGSSFVGPNPAYNLSPSGLRLNYVVSNDGSTDIGSTTLLIYTKTLSPTIILRGGDFCPGTTDWPGATTKYVKSYTSGQSTTVDEHQAALSFRAPNDEKLGTVTLRDSSGKQATTNYVSITSSTCSGADITIKVNSATTLSKDVSLPDYYVYTLTVKHDSSYKYYENGFAVEVRNSANTANDNTAYISQVPDESSSAGKNFGLQMTTSRQTSSGGSHGYGTFKIPFGPDCTVPSGGVQKAVTLYDLDAGNSGIQPKDLDIRIRRISKTTGLASNVNVSSIYWRNSGGSSYSAAPASSYTHDSNGYYTIKSSIGGDRTSVQLRFTVSQDYTYEIEMHNLYGNNTLQFAIPFATIWASVYCSASVDSSVTLSPSAYALDGQEVKATYTASNTSDYEASIYAQGYLWTETDNDSSYNGSDVMRKSFHTNNFIPPPGSTSIGDSVSVAANSNYSRQESYTINGVANNTRVCAAFRIDSANPITHVATKSWKVTCVPVAKVPSVQVTGGDVMTNGIVSTINSKIGSSTYGSWSEYGMYSDDTISSVSAARLATSAGRSSTGATNALTFANSPSNGKFGTLTLTDVSSQFVGAGWPASTAGATLSSLTSSDAQHVYNRSGNVTINTASLPAGKSVLVNATGTVTIAGNLTYADGPYASPSQVPQLIIRASKIIINSGVTHVDAWLIATGSDGTLSTCDASQNPYYKSLTSATCGAQLTVNGVIQANHLQLRRTAGADGTTDASRSESAERLNMRSDAYLWLYGQSSQSTNITTQAVTELSPRF